MNPMPLAVTVGLFWLSILPPAALAAPVKVAKDEESAWLRWLIPLPKQVTISEKAESAASDVKLRLRAGAGDVERNAAANMAALFKEKAHANGSKGSFEILIGVSDAKGKIEDLTLSDEATRLSGLPNAEQAYVIRPAGPQRLVLTALNERGVFHAVQTLRQLLENRFADGKETIPLATITDWPDLTERGEWGGNVEHEIEWMASHKMNLVESHVSLTMSEDGKGTAKADTDLIEQGRLHALKVVPIITHLDHLRGTGVYEKYPDLMGRGDSARDKSFESLLAPCFSKPKFTEVLAEWMNSLAVQKGVADVCVWLTEHHIQCGCDDCKKVGQYVLEARAIVKAWRVAHQQHPGLNLRILLTQGSYTTNDRVIAEIPDDVGVTYYDGGRTYNSSRDPMIYPLLEEYAAKGRWLGCYPQVTASWRIVCPWSAPQFIRYRMNEFVDKKLKCLCAYATPNNRLYDFNVTAAAEWSWNAKGRDEREFAAAWATRRGLKDPDAAAEWAVLLGPVGWDVYGSGIPYPHFFGNAADMIKNRTAPDLGKGMFRYFPTAERFGLDLAACDKALTIARFLDSPTILAETLVIQGYVKMIKEIHAIAAQLSAKPAQDEASRKKLQVAMKALNDACDQITDALRQWETAIGPKTGGSRFIDTVDVTQKTATGIGSVLAPFGVTTRPVR
jgi:hypothetical protein